MDSKTLDARLKQYNDITKENDELYREAAKKFGLSVCEFWILYFLRVEYAKPMQSEICSSFYLPKQSIHSALKKLEADGISAEVINIHTIKPLDTESIVNSAKKTGKVVTAEEHTVVGGLGSAVCDCLCEHAPVPVCKIGIYDVFGESGPALGLLEKYGLDGQGVYEKVKSFVK